MKKGVPQGVVCVGVGCERFTVPGNRILVVPQLGRLGALLNLSDVKWCTRFEGDRDDAECVWR